VGATLAMGASASLACVRAAFHFDGDLRHKLNHSSRLFCDWQFVIGNLKTQNADLQNYKLQIANYKFSSAQISGRLR
jgi:hypothetical protein